MKTQQADKSRGGDTMTRLTYSVDRLQRVSWLMTLLVMIFFSPAYAAAPGFVGAEACAGCHQAEFDSWKGSHHDLAMQHASEQSILGDFNGAEFTHHGVTSRFFRKDGKHYVTTDGADGKLQDFEIRFTFGVTPLQQYLVAFPGGRMQALSIAWDSRSKSDGGQRWFHLYPDERISHDDELHWSGPQQNWNYMCADCHSTRLVKGYDAVTDTFNTSWSEINVSCEACHGPGKQHADWAARPDAQRDQDKSRGLPFLLDERDDISWRMDPATGNAVRSQPNSQPKEIEVCATCHSRRGIISEGSVHEASFLDHYIPAFLTDGLYHTDGQIRDEVYVWGSFVQSKMHSAGVTCSDCHDPHGLQLKAPGNAVCSQCHLPSKYAVDSHHHHASDSAGAVCANCHMPQTTYMVVDPRRDHSIRIPRPDLSVEFDTPNACNTCHADQSASWASGKVKDWYPAPKPGHQTWTRALTAARSGSPRAGALLAGVVADNDTPDIARATAVLELRGYLDPETGMTLQNAMSDASPLVRIAALRTLEILPLQNRVPFAAPLLVDDVLAVRSEAGRILAGAPVQMAGGGGQNPLADAIGEYIDTQKLNADRAESHMNLGNLYVQMNNPVEAEKEYRHALRIDPGFIPGYVNLSELYRSQGSEKNAETILREAIRRQPENATLHHSLGLLLVRQKNSADALASLEKAHRYAPEVTRYAYVYAIALNSSGQGDKAIVVLEEAHRQTPNDGQLIFALATINRDLGDTEAARGWAEKLLLLNPDEPSVQQLLQSLR